MFAHRYEYVSLNHQRGQHASRAPPSLCQEKSRVCVNWEFISLAVISIHISIVCRQPGMQTVLQTDEHSAHALGDVTTQSDL